MKTPFEEVVTAHGPTVLRVCSAIVGRLDADDCWSDTFLAALRAYPDLPDDVNIEAWLVTVAHHKAVDFIRKSHRAGEPTAEVPGPVAREVADGRDLDLAASLARLPERQRFAVVYHYLGGLPYDEIAALAGGTAAAVRRAAADGIANLRKTHPEVN